MAEEHNMTLEGALASLERDVETAARAAAGAVRAIKALQNAVKQGELRKLDSAISAGRQAVNALGEQFATIQDGWTFDVKGYLSSGAFTRELTDCARTQDVNIFEQDERLYCYPSLIRVLPGEQCVKIDKIKEARLRPRVLAAHLKAVQQRPPRFSPEAFLESLHEAYRRLNPPQRGLPTPPGRVVTLLQIYELLTILPGQSREYVKAEFARDIYLLDRSAVTKTRNGPVVAFPASTGTRAPSALFTVITENGGQKTYYGISFHTSD